MSYSKQLKNQPKFNNSKKSKKKFDTSSEPNLDNVRELGVTKKFHPHDLASISPMNENQRTFLRLFYDEIPMILATAPAGCGKSFLAVYAALSLVLDPSTPYDKIVIIRSAVETRSQGFLPGELSEKNAPYEVPYIQACSAAIPKYKDSYKHLKALGIVEFHTTAFIRGLNFERTICILDEAQNADYEELSSAITRVADHSRIIILGDMKQCDLQRKKQTSGLEQVERVMNKMPPSMVGIVKFELGDIVRSGLVREFLIADYHTV